MFGSRISVVAFPMLVLYLDGSPFIAGLVSCATILPGLLAYIPAGVLVDRWKPLRVLLISEIGRGIARATIVVMLLFGGGSSVFLLIPAVVAEQILEVFATLAERRCASSLVAWDDIPRSQAILQARVHIAVLAGRPVGLFLFVLNPILPFLADALSFACSVLSLIAVQEMSDTLRSAAPDRLPATRLFDELRDGFRKLECDKHAIRTMVLMAGTTLIAQALLMVFLAEAHAGQLPAAAIGLLLAASGIGGVLGSAVAGRVPRLAQRNWLPVQMCACSAALGVLVSIGGRSLAAAVTVVAVFGFTGAIGNVTFTSYLAQTFPSRLARVSSIGQVLAIGAMGLGPMLGGTAIDRYDASKAIGVLLSIAIFMLLVSVRSHGFRLGIGRRTACPAERAILVRLAWATARLAPWWSSGRRKHDANRWWLASDLGMSFRVVLDRPGPAQGQYPEPGIHSSRAGPISRALAQGLREAPCAVRLSQYLWGAKYLLAPGWSTRGLS
jgi:MFS family permease